VFLYSLFFFFFFFLDIRMQEQRLVWDRKLGRHVNTPHDAPVKAHFIRGPIPSWWIQQAGRLPGKALHVGLAAWELAGLKNSHQGLALSSERLTRYGVSRFAKTRALKELAEAGLVTVRWHRNRSPVIDLRLVTSVPPGNQAHSE